MLLSPNISGSMIFKTLLNRLLLCITILISVEHFYFTSSKLFFNMPCVFSSPAIQIFTGHLILVILVYTKEIMDSRALGVKEFRRRGKAGEEIKDTVGS